MDGDQWAIGKWAISKEANGQIGNYPAVLIKTNPPVETEGIFSLTLKTTNMNDVDNTSVVIYFYFS